MSPRNYASQGRAAQAGFTLIELLIVVAVCVTLAAFGLIRTQSGLAAFKANGAMSSLKAKLQAARELAITRQRDVTITFSGTNTVTFNVVNPDASLTRVDSIALEGNMIFTTFSGQGAPAAEVPCTQTLAVNPYKNLNGMANLRFNSDGAMIDSTTRLPVSGCLYLGNADTNAATARSIGMFGTTGRARTYRWSNTTWVH